MHRTIRVFVVAGLLTLLNVSCDEGGCRLPNQNNPVPETTRFVRDAEYQDGRIFDLFLYEEVSIAPVPASIECSLFIDPMNPGLHIDKAQFLQMAEIGPEEWVFFNDTSRHGHFIVFEGPIQRYRSLGAFIIVDRYDNANTYLQTDTIGSLSTDTLKLKMLAAGTWMDPSHPVWPLTWRNCYAIPKGLDIEDIDLSVCQAPLGQEDTAAIDYRQLSPDSLDEGCFLTILGLDQYNRNGLKLPDGELDERPPVFHSDWGLIIFPSRQPFDSDTTFVDAGGARTAQLRVRVPELYDYNSLNERYQSSRYYLQIRVREH